MVGRLIPLAAIGAGLYLSLASDEAGDTEAPRGIRNNNPGNIERGDNWRGLADDQSADDRFAVFTDAKWGIRALARTLDTYRGRHGIDTVKGIISRWAPPSENDTASYIEFVADRVGAAPTDPLPENDATRRELVKAIIEHENGMQPYPDSLIRRGVALA